ncbi:MAG: ATP-dependent helicase [Planctomycetota bacterium]|jgi:DNA helicase-2/ATP-dependent DNA helicase PcrA
MDPILDDLNDSQREAVLHGSGPLMVLAGAGSGKTRVITRRIARLIRDGVPSRQIRALTFTNKAAGEMARRVQELGGSRVQVSTFHSSCARFLREHGQLLGFPKDFSIYDTYDRDSCIKMLMNEAKLDHSRVRPAQVGRRISQLKNLGYSPRDVVLGMGEIDEAVDRLFAVYEETMLRLGAMDFDDLLGKFLEVLKGFPEVAESYQDRFRWLLVDEFQDTNRIQYDVCKRLLGDTGNVCVVGDPDQSIYRFRGAEIRNILDFEYDFPDLVTIRLETNYRSTALILRAAIEVIRHNSERKEKDLRTDNAEGEPIVLHRAHGPSAEARRISDVIQELLAEGTDIREIAIFYRSHFLSRGLEESLREYAIPYQVVGGLSFFERREIKDLLAYMRVIVNPADDVSMERIINVPPRGIGKKTLEKIRGMAREAGQSVFATICSEAARAHLSPRARKAMASLAEAFAEAGKLVKSAHQTMSYLAQEVGYLDYIGDLGDPEDVARRENVAELHNDAATFDRDVGEGLAGYLQHVSLITAEDRKGEDIGRVSLMTVHAAKGLEFDQVFVTGLEEGIFPNSRVMLEGDIEEERRLMHVAMTRARKRIWMSHSRTRMVAGILTRQEPSSFIPEIPEDCLLRTSSMDPEGDGNADQGWEDDREIDYSQESQELEEGMRVKHRNFGRGTVMRLRGEGFKAKATIRFDRGGEKILILQYGDIEPITGEELC